MMGKKIITAILILLFLVSCEKEIENPAKGNAYPEQPESLIAIQKENPEGTSYKSYVLEYEGCEYLVVGSFLDSRMMSHKGNCKNPIHIQPHAQ